MALLSRLLSSDNYFAQVALLSRYFRGELWVVDGFFLVSLMFGSLHNSNI